MSDYITNYFVLSRVERVCSPSWLVRWIPIKYLLVTCFVSNIIIPTIICWIYILIHRQRHKQVKSIDVHIIQDPAKHVEGQRLEWSRVAGAKPVALGSNRRGEQSKVPHLLPAIYFLKRRRAKSSRLMIGKTVEKLLSYL